MASWSPGRLDVVARGGDGAIWQRVYDDGWQNWVSLDGRFVA